MLACTVCLASCLPTSEKFERTDGRLPQVRSGYPLPNGSVSSPVFPALRALNGTTLILLKRLWPLYKMVCPENIRPRQCWRYTRIRPGPEYRVGDALVIANSSSSLVTLFNFSILLSTAAALLPYALCCRVVALEPRRRLRKKLIALGAFVYSLWH